ncbi:putative protein N(5)-glutamine methyltransferase [Pseudarthrobacter sp. So.54]
MAAAATGPDHLDALVERRISGQPLEHVLGWAEFCGLRIAVDPGVFVPRRRTGFLVKRAVRLLRHKGSPGRLPVVVDLCCGSGAVGAALAVLAGPLKLYAADIDAAAVRCAARNVAPFGGKTYEGDLYEPLPAHLRGAVDVLAVNAPYVPSAEISTMPREARLHEPRASLDGGDDGQAVHRQVAAAATMWLAPGGSLLIETSRGRRRRPWSFSPAMGSRHGWRGPRRWTRPLLSGQWISGEPISGQPGATPKLPGQPRPPHPCRRVIQCS